MVESKYDVIVIGTGCGGAAAGALAAYHGHKTLILEKNSIVGGRTATYERDGFKMDHGHIMLRCDRGPHGKLLRMVESDDLMPKYSYCMNFGMRVYIGDKLFDANPDRMNILQVFGLLKQLYKFKISIPDIIKIIHFIRIVDKMPEQTVKGLYKVDAKTFFNLFINDDFFFQFLSGVSTVCLGASMDEVSAGVMVRLLRSSVFRAGYPVNGEGVSAIPRSFLRAAERYGAEVILNTAVDQIVVENNTVCGVMADGQFIEADKVISGVGIGETVLRLVGEDKFDQKYTEKIKNLKYSYEGFSLKYALDKPVTDWPWGGEMPGNMEQITSQMSRGILPERLPWMYVAASDLDSGIAPKGKQAIYVISGGAPPEPGYIDWDKWMNRIKEQVAEFFPGIEKHIIFCEESTPDEIANFSGRINGDAVGVAQTVDQAGELRPSPVSPVRGLYYTGADVGKDQVGTELATESAIALEPYLERSIVN